MELNGYTRGFGSRYHPRAELGATSEVVATVPYFESDIYDLRGLVRLGDKVWC